MNEVQTDTAIAAEQAPQDAEEAIVRADADEAIRLLNVALEESEKEIAELAAEEDANR